MANSVNTDLKENSVRYCLYPLIQTIDGLNDYISTSFSSLAKCLTQYIWDNQSFNLRVVSDGSGNHLEGVTNFGDNVEDEWLIVYLLYELTRLDPNLVIKVDDTDGQFLLIEAANDLPKWVDPEKSVNRVYIYRESVHIIPYKTGPIQRRTPSVREAIAVVRQFPDLTKTDEKIETSVKKRIECYPSRIIEYQHKSHCFVPLGVAALLKHNPSLISLAVKAFYNRTADDLKVCQTMKYFPPESRFMRCITLTRCLFAQLMSQNYKPDPKVGWNIPPVNHPKFKSHDLGMKIASGFEILVSYSKMSKENEDSVECKHNDRWNAFYESLNKNGYFDNQLFGSKKYKELTQSAQNYFYQFMSAKENDDDMDSVEYNAKKVFDCLQSLDIDQNEYEIEAQSLEKESSDEWLNLSSEELDALLSEKFSTNYKSNDCSDYTTQIPSALKSFVSNESSGIKGAEAPDVSRPSKPKRINFNENAFEEALNTVLSFKVPQSETDSSSSGMSDYSDDEESLDSDDDFYKNNLNNGTEKGINEMKTYMNAMDQQLAQTKVGKSFERTTSVSSTKENNNNKDTEYKAVDIDLNSLTNILESYNSECGNPGPATALFSTMGVKLPDNADSD